MNAFKCYERTTCVACMQAMPASLAEMITANLEPYGLLSLKKGRRHDNGRQECKESPSDQG